MLMNKKVRRGLVIGDSQYSQGAVCLKEGEDAGNDDGRQRRRLGSEAVMTWWERGDPAQGTGPDAGLPPQGPETPPG